MPHEIEAKMQLADRERLAALERALVMAGAQRGPEVIEVNTYFDSKTGSMRQSDQGLRVRLETEIGQFTQHATITHKGPVVASKVKSRPETELVVDDADKAIALLEALGFVSGLSFEKHRRKWELDRCEVVIDTLPFLGHFVEIEGPSEQDVLSVRNKLQLEHLPLIQSSYISMLKKYLDENRITQRHISLSASG